MWTKAKTGIIQPQSKNIKDFGDQPEARKKEGESFSKPSEREWPYQYLNSVVLVFRTQRQ